MMQTSLTMQANLMIIMANGDRSRYQLQHAALECQRQACVCEPAFFDVASVRPTTCAELCV